jgi:hypothetical protein
LVTIFSHRQTSCNQWLKPCLIWLKKLNTYILRENYQYVPFIFAFLPSKNSPVYCYMWKLIMGSLTLHLTQKRKMYLRKIIIISSGSHLPNTCGGNPDNFGRNSSLDKSYMQEKKGPLEGTRIRSWKDPFYLYSIYITEISKTHLKLYSKKLDY